MSLYERRPRSNVLGGGGTRLPDGGNANIRQRDSGHLVVPATGRGFGLIKPSTSTVARARDEVMSKLFDGGAYAHQRLNLGTKGKAHRRNAKASNRTWEIPPSGIIGGPRETLVLVKL